jgi:hypothetical protein
MTVIPLPLSRLSRKFIAVKSASVSLLRLPLIFSLNMTANGVMLCTFTPLLGLSDVALMFLPGLAPEMN